MIPVEIPGLPAPDTSWEERLLLGDLDLTQPIDTDWGRVEITGRSVTGWSGGVGSTTSRRKRPNRPGTVASRNPQLTERSLQVQFMLQAESPAAMRAAWDVLNEAVPIDDFTLTRDEWGLRRQITVRRDGPIPEGLFAAAVVKKWSVQLVADDPRKYGARVSRSTRLPFTTGGLVFPTAAPWTSDAQSSTGIVTIRNDGTAPSPVVLRIDGPVVAPTVTHVGSGRQLVFGASYSLPAGNWLDIDLDNRTVLENGIADRSQWVTGRGFFAAEKGLNTYTFQAAAYNPDARLTVTTASAWE